MSETSRSIFYPLRLTLRAQPRSATFQTRTLPKPKMRCASPRRREMINAAWTNKTPIRPGLATAGRGLFWPRWFWERCWWWCG